MGIKEKLHLYCDKCSGHSRYTIFEYADNIKNLIQLAESKGWLVESVAPHTNFYTCPLCHNVKNEPLPWEAYSEDKCMDCKDFTTLDDCGVCEDCFEERIVIGCKVKYNCKGE